jgi:putative ABC transport system substrate-binding protein
MNGCQYPPNRQTIPIVMTTVVDPVATGLVGSLAHPGGNITGLTGVGRELSGKRLELLNEVVPRMSRVGVLWDMNAPGPTLDFKEYEATAPALNIELQPLEIHGPNPDLEGAVQAAVKGHANALITIGSSLLSRYPKQIADLAIKNRLPVMCDRTDYVQAGGLVSYSANDVESNRRAAIYVDKIL